MDLRGFTAWSETQPPESVVEALNAYCRASEAAFEAHPPIRFKFAADEVMAVFAELAAALAAARGLSASVAGASRTSRLGAGIGLHWGRSLRA